MKICFSSFTCPEYDLANILTTAKDIGYHGVEIRMDAHHAHGLEVGTTPELRARYAQEFKNYSIEPVCLATSVQMTHENAPELLEGRILMASEMGFKAVRVFCGRSEAWDSTADIVDLVVPRLAKAAKYANPMNIQIWLETHDTAVLGATARQILHEIDQENMGIVYNNLHPYRMGEGIDETLAAIGPYLRYVRLNDGLNDPQKVIVKPMRQGQMPLDQMFQALAVRNYQGYVCGEWFYNQCGEDPHAALGWYYQQVTALAELHGVAMRFD